MKQKSEQNEHGFNPTTVITPTVVTNVNVDHSSTLINPGDLKLTLSHFITTTDEPTIKTMNDQCMVLQLTVIQGGPLILRLGFWQVSNAKWLSIVVVHTHSFLRFCMWLLTFSWLGNTDYPVQSVKDQIELSK